MTAVVVDTHRCLAGKACRNAATVDGARQGAPTEKRNTLCPGCRMHIESAVRELPQDWAELRDALGERTASGEKVRSSPTAAIPINTRKEAIMAAIEDMADRAAAVVSDLLNTDQPDARRKPQPILISEEMQQLLRLPPNLAGKTTLPLPGTAASDASSVVKPEPGQILAAAIAITQPNIAVLATAPAEPALIWKKPQRCRLHTTAVDRAESILEEATEPEKVEEARELVRRAYASAGACDDCNGWWRLGQQREIIEMSGIDIALHLTELHNQARAELGLTRLRHSYTMPCPDCGGEVYRNDGESIVICEENPKHARTEREYKLLAGLRIEERVDMNIRTHLLAESYWRLDRIQKLVDMVDKDATVDTDPRVGRMILNHLKDILTQGAPDRDGNPIPHQRPEKRATGTGRRAALERQVDEDNWAWKNEKPYQPPKTKRKQQRTPIKSPIAAASLTTLVDIDENAVINGDARCRDCNLIPCDCP
jgi:hypothetical protein